MTDLTETTYSLIPSIEKFNVVYFTATKAAQNDTITFGDHRVCYGAWGFVDAGGDWEAETVTVDASTVNMINLTGAATGTVHGFAILVK